MIAEHVQLSISFDDRIHSARNSATMVPVWQCNQAGFFVIDENVAPPEDVPRGPAELATRASTGWGGRHSGKRTGKYSSQTSLKEDSSPLSLSRICLGRKKKVKSRASSAGAGRMGEVCMFAGGAGLSSSCSGWGNDNGSCLRHIIRGIENGSTFRCCWRYAFNQRTNWSHYLNIPGRLLGPPPIVKQRHNDEGSSPLWTLAAMVVFVYAMCGAALGVIFTVLWSAHKSMSVLLNVLTRVIHDIPPQLRATAIWCRYTWLRQCNLMDHRGRLRWWRILWLIISCCLLFQSIALCAPARSRLTRQSRRSCKHRRRHRRRNRRAAAAALPKDHLNVKRWRAVSLHWDPHVGVRIGEASNPGPELAAQEEPPEDLFRDEQSDDDEPPLCDSSGDEGGPPSLDDSSSDDDRPNLGSCSGFVEKPKSYAIQLSEFLHRPVFVKARLCRGKPKHGGPVSGYMYGTKDEGTGYYRDDVADRTACFKSDAPAHHPHTVETVCAGLVRPAELGEGDALSSLSPTVDDTPAAVVPNSGSAVEPQDWLVKRANRRNHKGGKRTRRNKKASSGGDSSLLLGETTHTSKAAAALGLFSIDSWNLNSWYAGIDTAADSSAEVMLL